jgi:MFS family permease
VVSLISGIVGLTFIPLVSSVVAIITGHVAKKKIQQSQGREGGEGMATAGLVMGYIGLVLWGLLLLFGILIAGWFVSEGPEFIRDLEELETLFSPTPTI